ncbi:MULTISPECIES: helix-turn-helix transcriptional regulator [unclassified Moraxella]|uniref:helix-turn-helix transcriptional regulator n=1 Tax=unclassified Moraxella TaxID=2685852 RepID=UPI003AF491E0
MTKPSKNEEFSIRLVSILQKLNNGETLKIDELAETHQTSVRTIQRDFHERLAFMPLEKIDANSYRLEPSYLGKLTIADIKRFADFASVSELFSKVDQNFFHKYLLDSINIKGFNYESIGNKQAEFDLINQAIVNRQYLSFHYRRVKAKASDSSVAYVVQPYKLVNKSGVWYLIAIHDDKIKVFSFTRISLPKVEDDTFVVDKAINERIEAGDGIYFEGVIDEVILKVDGEVAVYFTRRNLLPNQEIMRELTDGTLIVACKKVHEQEILPLIRYWIPYVDVVAPDAMKVKLVQQLQGYLEKPNKDSF